MSTWRGLIFIERKAGFHGNLTLEIIKFQNYY